MPKTYSKIRSRNSGGKLRRRDFAFNTEIALSCQYGIVERNASHRLLLKIRAQHRSLSLSVVGSGV